MSNRRRLRREAPPPVIHAAWVVCQSSIVTDGGVPCESPAAVVLIDPRDVGVPLLLCVDHYEHVFGTVPMEVPPHDFWTLTAVAS